MESLRRRLTALAVLGAVAPAAPSVASASVTAASPRSASLEHFACTRAAEALNRAVAVTAVMRPVAGTRRMELKFVLLRRRAGTSAFTPVSGKGLGRWVHPDDPNLGQRPGDVWEYAKPVVNLVAPAVYRFRVTFRWDEAATRSDAVLLSSTCDQKGS